MIANRGFLIKIFLFFYELQGVKKISLTTCFLPCIIAFVA
ncbi:hypothetical protein HMPREF1373_01170 [Enterococcus faecium P1140]|nr:hypothetical protein HMPREF1381_00480 [Enterococcus faecium R501]EJX71950.1 hypothetical protein HMPREF1373_01170 [Enterococcus faecium P1140]EJY00916.1 hypothetical protein HMPREF1364_01083 [Enterococcus faecium ERV165]EJY25505.1 hypothetical protein HMPREF1356_00147 [Enterococcus faecium C1904]MBK4752891.1 hypothetical protein [Enterococcus faecium]